MSAISLMYRGTPLSLTQRAERAALRGRRRRTQCADLPEKAGQDRAARSLRAYGLPFHPPTINCCDLIEHLARSTPPGSRTKEC